MTYYIGIDPGTRTGWAVLAADGACLASGTWALDNRKGDGAGMRYLRFGRLFRELLAAFPGSMVGYELVARHVGTDAAHVYGGLVAQLMCACEELVVPYSGIAVGTVKKHATGKGNANKGVMVFAAMDRWPHAPVMDDNEADSLWIADALREGKA